jgi:hypothetical protein
MTAGQDPRGKGRAVKAARSAPAGLPCGPAALGYKGQTHVQRAETKGETAGARRGRPRRRDLGARRWPGAVLDPRAGGGGGTARRSRERDVEREFPEVRRCGPRMQRAPGTPRAGPGRETPRKCRASAGPSGRRFARFRGVLRTSDIPERTARLQDLPALLKAQASQERLIPRVRPGVLGCLGETSQSRSGSKGSRSLACTVRRRNSLGGLLLKLGDGRQRAARRASETWRFGSSPGSGFATRARDVSGGLGDCG